MTKLILFYSSWNPSCDKYREIIFNLSEEYKNKFIYEEIDVDSNDSTVGDMISLYGIRSVPTTIIQTCNGETKIFGLVAKDELIEKLLL